MLQQWANMVDAWIAGTEFTPVVFQSKVAASLTVSLLTTTLIAVRAAMKPAGDCLCDEEAQGWNRVGHMPLRPTGARAVCNLGVRKTFVVERSFFWSRHG